jgi:hypothetical protein
MTVTTSTRRIGLSLGADICWPICFEEILGRLDLELPIGKERVRFEVERVTIEPFNLRQPTPYDLVLDRLTYWYSLSREWIKKAVLMDGVYVLNNPWTVQSMEKHTSYCAMMRLGMPVPETLLIPPKAHESNPDLQVTLQRYAKLFRLEDVGRDIGYPLFVKPYDGGGWVGVAKVESDAEFHEAYDESDKSLLHAQKGLLPYDGFVRCVGMGPQTRIVAYDPSAPLHERYEPDLDLVASGRISQEEADLITDTTVTINAFFGWDFNSCEMILKDGVWHPFDFANPCPDSQVTSLHVHFPWVVLAKLKWAIYCAATRRPMRINLDWAPFFEIAAQDLPYREKLRGYATIARETLDAAAFEAFCETHLPNIDEVARDFFGTERAKDAIRMKVHALFPEQDWNEFTERFWNLIQSWRGSTV